MSYFSYFFLLFPPAVAAAPAPASPAVQKGIFKRQSPKIEPLPAANPYGSEGRKSIKIAHQKLPNVTSETYRKG